MRDSKANRQGRAAFNKGKRYRDNPYPHGSTEWQQWINGYSDASDDLTLKLCKKYPQVMGKLFTGP